MQSNVSRPVICQLLHSLSVGGAEILASQYAERSREMARTVFVCLEELGDLGERLRGAGAEIEVFRRQPGFDYRLTRDLASFFRDQMVDVVHAQQYTPFFYAALSRLPRGGPPILFTEHGRTYPDYRRPKRVLANKFLLRRSDRVAAVGEQVKRALVANEGIESKRIEVIYNGIDVAAFRRDTGKRSEVRRELGLQESDLAVMQVARLNQLKDHLTAVRAWHRLSSCPSIRLFLVGEGEERAAIEKMIGELKLQRTVTLLGTRTDVPRLLNGADVFLMTSVSEGIPLTLIEAMANGLPCVSTSVGGISEVIVDGQTGLLSAAGDDLAISVNVQCLASSAEQRQRLGAAGRERAERLFSDRVMHDAYHRLYREMAGVGGVSS
ncbi:glycosyltransferase [Allorhodopirellula solitaria]|uniref:Putative glycosyltransferase EpsD n=1 Tax=Allorhodopirellula solitaria TaxID=2527987 RepID=A0A5C5WP81_9BACT|nr:glycosyltransferase [Allorhodopirellula solitaria]TWT51911.1 putative glycosyltransferase EpsD [Allorhodopirellula solitaria]